MLVVSSDNIHVNRNLLQNPSSTFELSTHLQDVSAIVDATANYWGTTDYEWVGVVVGVSFEVFVVCCMGEVSGKIVCVCVLNLIIKMKSIFLHSKIEFEY